MSLPGVSLVGLFIFLHLLRAERAGAELKLLACVILIGGVWETALIFFDLLAYPHSIVFHGLAPAWLLALWALFAAQFNTTYRWLKQRVVAGAFLGALAGPLSFHAGAKLGALQFVKPVAATASLALGWAVILPVIILLSRRWNGVGASTSPP